MAFAIDELHAGTAGWAEKIAVLAIVVVFYILMVYLLKYLIDTGSNVIYMIVVILIIVLSIPVSIYAVDIYLWEGGE